MNGVTVDARRADVFTDPLPETAVAVANIELAAVDALARSVRAATFVTSGYLQSDRPSLPGWEHARRVVADGWAADLSVRI